MFRGLKSMVNLVVILAAVSIVSLLSFIGILFIGLKEAFLNRILTALIGFASGSLIHLLRGDRWRNWCPIGYRINFPWNTDTGEATHSRGKQADAPR